MERTHYVCTVYNNEAVFSLHTYMTGHGITLAVHWTCLATVTVSDTTT